MELPEVPEGYRWESSSGGGSYLRKPGVWIPAPQSSRQDKLLIWRIQRNNMSYWHCVAENTTPEERLAILAARAWADLPIGGEDETT